MVQVTIQMYRTITNFDKGEHELWNEITQHRWTPHAAVL